MSNIPTNSTVTEHQIHARWGQIEAVFTEKTENIIEGEVSNIHAIAFLGNLIVLVRSRTNGWELPGGTREPGESLEQTIRRELLEEIGAKFESFITFGFWRCLSRSISPYKPHIPHPHFSILLCSVLVTSLSAPTGWGNGDEDHVAIALVSFEEAVTLLAETPGGRPHSEVLRQYLHRCARYVA